VNERIDLLERELKREGKKSREAMNEMIRHTNAVSFKEEPTYKTEKPQSIANNDADKYHRNLERIIRWSCIKITSKRKRTD
jgi:hypothetical protein